MTLDDGFYGEVLTLMVYGSDDLFLLLNQNGDFKLRLQ